MQLKINSVKDEIAAVSRKVSLIENETARKSKNCNALEKGKNHVLLILLLKAANNVDCVRWKTKNNLKR